MNHIAKFSLIAFLAFAIISCKKEQKTTEEEAATATDSVAQTESPKIVTLSGAITEIVSALGHESDIVGVDVTSTYPEGIKESAQDLGHSSKISIEAVMALQPTLILGSNEDISPELKEKIELSGTKAHFFDQEYTPEGTKTLIGQIATVLQSDNAQKLQDKIDADLAKVKELDKTQKVLFIYARGAGMMMVGGINTPVNEVITLAGAENAVEDIDGYKPLTPEALIKANPDVILMFHSGLASLNGEEGVLKIQGIEKTNAGKNKNIIAMDGALLAGFGPRLGEATLQLNKKLRANAK
ncbi:hemin ABC transporter substrate-binding protein [Flavobacterium suaedae]|uniref:Hemin ABC transporter substrate-binding protein n=1 Tax=Flavobacterium suaedae TaxID=1767027 RepID=A0ABQ1JT09_9FLAO|nr:ABC transporter substrate-binding protein [Flavobacterium suaedae]GGB77025.1 hemin ABC transporter substrate-binding protein [Flavobacterium suaedae]